MNYIRHLNTFFSLMSTDTRLSASHISLYMALFQYWNFNRFQNPFPIYRDNMMKQSKIGSKNTYHKCIKDLHQLKYIYYHPSGSKFLPVKVSVARLDVPEEPVSRYRQLELFSIERESKNSKSILPSPLGEGGQRPDEVGGDACPNNGTDSVPILRPMSTDFDTVPVPKMGHNIKHKHLINESKQPAQKIFDKNEKINQEINRLGGVSNSVHDELPLSSAKGVKKEEVESFFQQNNYPPTEAQKFFNHYQSIGWKIKGITPITDWQAAAQKWMLNAEKFENKKQNELPTPKNDMESLYKLFLAGQNIFKQITSDHFTQLKLELTKDIMQYALKERINQLTGTNQFSLSQLWNAYLQGNQKNELLVKDKPILIALAQRIAVLNHFQIQKQHGSTSLSSRPPG